MSEQEQRDIPSVLGPDTTDCRIEHGVFADRREDGLGISLRGIYPTLADAEAAADNRAGTYPDYPILLASRHVVRYPWINVERHFRTDITEGNHS